MKAFIVSAGLAAFVLTGTVSAEETVPQRTYPSKEESMGVLSGAGVGALAGGPLGAVLGAAFGAWFGDRVHQRKETIVSLNEQLKASGEQLKASDEKVLQLSKRLQDSDEQAAALAMRLRETRERLAKTNEGS